MFLLDKVVSSLVAVRKGVAAFQAMEASLMNAALALALEHADGSRGDGDLPVREVAAEIGAALRVSDRTVQRQLDQARTLTVDFPAAHAALAEGRISRAHVHVITEAAAHLADPAVRAQYEQIVLQVAEGESASRLRPYARLVAHRLHPRTADERHRAAATVRGVSVTDLDDGMSELLLTAPSPLVHGIRDRITRLAKAVQDDERAMQGARTAQEAGMVPGTGTARDGETGRDAMPTGDAGVAGAGADVQADADTDERADADTDGPRTLDQLRADILCDLALTGTPAGHATAHTPAELLGAIRAEVHVTVPVLGATGATGEPAMLDGMQPMDTATALRLAGTATGWDRVLTHPVTGAVLAVDRYRPSAELRRHLQAIDHRCRFPGCMIPARRCDLDHVHDAADGGATAADNLADACRRHHVLKHRTRWRAQKQPDGTIEWTSPTGRRYPDRTHPRVVFVPASGEEAPFERPEKTPF